MKPFCWTLLLFVCCSLNGFADDAGAAQAPSRVQLDPAAMGLPSGHWREYRFRGGLTDGDTVRYTWLEKEIRDDTAYQWFETAMSTNGRHNVSRVLINLDDSTAIPERVIMQTGETQAMDMPLEMRQLATPALARYAMNPPRALDEQVEIEVPAGRFDTVVYEADRGQTAGRTYYAPELPGVVLYDGPNGGMELIAYGDDGASSVIGDVRPYAPLPPGVAPTK